MARAPRYRVMAIDGSAPVTRTPQLSLAAAAARAICLSGVRARVDRGSSSSPSCVVEHSDAGWSVIGCDQFRDHLAEILNNHA